MHGPKQRILIPFDPLAYNSSLAFAACAPIFTAAVRQDTGERTDRSEELCDPPHVLTVRQPQERIGERVRHENRQNLQHNSNQAQRAVAVG